MRDDPREAAIGGDRRAGASGYGRDRHDHHAGTGEPTHAIRRRTAASDGHQWSHYALAAAARGRRLRAGHRLRQHLAPHPGQRNATPARDRHPAGPWCHARTDRQAARRRNIASRPRRRHSGARGRVTGYPCLADVGSGRHASAGVARRRSHDAAHRDGDHPAHGFRLRPGAGPPAVACQPEGHRRSGHPDGQPITSAAYPRRLGDCPRPRPSRRILAPRYAASCA